jgi:hypothetical protein
MREFIAFTVLNLEGDVHGGLTFSGTPDFFDRKDVNCFDDFPEDFDEKKEEKQCKK